MPASVAALSRPGALRKEQKQQKPVAQRGSNGVVGKRRLAAGAAMAPFRGAESFLTRKGSEFGIVRAKAIKVTSRYQILEKVR